jgi:hypothetical protein
MKRLFGRRVEARRPSNWCPVCGGLFCDDDFWALHEPEVICEVFLCQSSGCLLSLSFDDDNRLRAERLQAGSVARLMRSKDGNLIREKQRRIRMRGGEALRGPALSVFGRGA